MYYNNQLTSNGGSITIRWITGEDRADRNRIERLAQLDSSRRPAGPYLIAEADGRPIAARSMVDGKVVADPFHPTAGAVQMLEVRAAQLAGEHRGARRRRIGRGVFDRSRHAAEA